MRRFWLKNDTDVWDLTSNEFADKNSFFAYPEGLGVKVKINSFEVDRAFFIESVKIEDTQISGKLYFKDYAHFEKFTEFTGYIETTKPLRLYYSTSESVSNYEDEWYKLVLIKEITKGEIDPRTGSLICPIKFEALSRWKKDQKITLELAPFGSLLFIRTFTRVLRQSKQYGSRD